jgi:hypothetical protein
LQQPKKWIISQNDKALHIRDAAEPSKSEASVKDELEGYAKALLKHLGKE